MFCCLKAFARCSGWLMLQEHCKTLYMLMWIRMRRVHNFIITWFNELLLLVQVTWRFAASTWSVNFLFNFSKSLIFRDIWRLSEHISLSSTMVLRRWAFSIARVSYISTCICAISIIHCHGVCLIHTNSLVPKLFAFSMGCCLGFCPHWLAPTTTQPFYHHSNSFCHHSHVQKH